MKKALIAAVLGLSLVTANSSADDLTALARPTIRGGAADSQIYFVMTDRFANGDTSNDQGGLTGFPATTGYDPSDIGYFHGGDLKGLTSKLDYIQGLGFNSIWITPPVKQKYVQGNSAAYHGYWALDFTTIDPHLGTEEDFKNFVSEAHKRGMKVIVDIVVNHTADVIKYKNNNYDYVSMIESPYKDCNGKKFDPTKYAEKSNFPKLCTTKSFPKIPLVSNAESRAKAPAFLNDSTNYHNRGDSTFNGESSTYGDFFGLDDLFTEKPQVLSGEIKLWQEWITKYDIDGYRIDTAKHVNPEFWKAFIPAILKRAKDAGKSSFPIFGEVADGDPNILSKYVTEYKFPGVLDFAFQAATVKFATYGFGEKELKNLFNQDDLYTSATSSAYGLTTFIDNHDMGRIGMFIDMHTNSTDAELLQRDQLAQSMLFLLRGGPAYYYGDEKGMTGSGGDKSARQDMFPTKVLDWQKERRVGSQPIGTGSSFDITNPLEGSIKSLQALTKEYPALRSGTQQLRYSADSVFAVSRYLNNQEFLVAFNGGDEGKKVQIPVSTKDSEWQLISGSGLSSASSGNMVSLNLPARSWAVFKASKSFEPVNKLAVTLNKPFEDLFTRDLYIALTASVPGDDFTEVTFAAQSGSGSWKIVGTSDHRVLGANGVKDGDYRVYLHPADYKKGSIVKIVAIALNAKGEKLASNIQSYKIA